MAEENNNDEGDKAENTLLVSDGDTDAVKKADGVDEGSNQNTDDKGEGDADSKADDKANDGAPENYGDFVLPEGVELDKERLDSFTPVAKEMNLSQENAQKLVDFYAKTVDGVAATQAKDWADIQSGWRDEASSDTEYGGKDFQENIGLAKKALDAFGNEKLKEALNTSGMGNHPEMIRLLVKIGNEISDDKFSFGKESSEPKSHAQIMFPSMNE